MHVDKLHSTGTSFITDLVSLTLILSAVIFGGAICRYLKKCYERFSKKKNSQGIIGFTEIRRKISHNRRSSSRARMNAQVCSIVYHNDVPIKTENVAVQPNIDGIFTRPRAPRIRMKRQTSVPVPLRAQTTFAGCNVTRSSSIHIESCDLQPGLYKREISLQEFQTQNKYTCGNLYTEIFYDAKNFKLKVTVNNVQLHLHKHAEETNSYVTVRKIPDQTTRRTSLHTNAIHPVYNDEFVFNIDPRDDVKRHVLLYGLNHVDKFSNSSLRGVAYLPLFQLDLSLLRTIQIPFVEVKRPLFTSIYSNCSNITGCILVSLKYKPWKEEIVVNPVRVIYVPGKRNIGYAENVYIKIDLRFQGERIRKQKSDLVQLERMIGCDYYKASFNETFNLSYQPFEAEESEIYISLNHNLFLKNFIIGQVRMSRGQPGYESSHFQSMIDSPGNEISVWYEMRGCTNFTAFANVVHMK